jgi:hypothetical protein
MGNCGTREENAVVPAAHAQGNFFESFFLAPLLLPSSLQISSRYTGNQCPCCAHRNFSLGGLFFSPWDLSRWVGWLVAESPRYDLCPRPERWVPLNFCRFLFRLMGLVLQILILVPNRSCSLSASSQNTDWIEISYQIVWFCSLHLLKSHPSLSYFLLHFRVKLCLLLHLIEFRVHRFYF